MRRRQILGSESEPREVPVEYDQDRNEVTIDGVRYAQGAFRSFFAEDGLYQIATHGVTTGIQKVGHGGGVCLVCGKRFKELAKHAKGCT